MSIKKVPLQDLELWPDEVICFSAYTDTRNPVQQRRIYVDGSRYAELQAENAQLRDDLETQREAAWHNTKRNAREYKRVRDENDRLRELVIDMHLTADEFSEKYERPFYVDKFLFRDNHIHKRERELGIEVPE